MCICFGTLRMSAFACPFEVMSACFLALRNERLSKPFRRHVCLLPYFEERAPSHSLSRLCLLASLLRCTSTFACPFEVTSTCFLTLRTSAFASPFEVMSAYFLTLKNEHLRKPFRGQVCMLPSFEDERLRKPFRGHVCKLPYFEERAPLHVHSGS